MDRNSFVLWIARIWGTLILAFLLGFLVPGIFGAEAGEGLRDAREIVTFILFPMCTVVGLGVAYRWAGLGGLIATAGTIGLFVLRPDLVLSPWFTFAIAPPGVLYLAYWAMTKTSTNNQLN